MSVVSQATVPSHIWSRSSQQVRCINSDGAIRSALSGRNCRFILWLGRLTQHSHFRLPRANCRPPAEPQLPFQEHADILRARSASGTEIQPVTMISLLMAAQRQPFG